MRRIKLLLLAVVMVVVALAIAPPAQVNAEPGDVIVYVQVPGDWEEPGFWAWGPRGDAFPSWPGGAFMSDPGNPGWYFIYVPSDKTGGLVNANGGSIQTGDFPLTGVPVWVTVSGAGDEFEVTTEKQTQGDFPLPETLIYVQVPDDWANPGFWAWGPRGDAFPSWPGGQFLQDPNNPGWFFITVPRDKTGGLVNANDGSIQTSDFDLDGRPIWVTVNGPGGEFEVTHTPQTQGDLPSMYTILYAQVPSDWDAPHVWAWGPRGDAFPHWPGQPMQEDPNNPGWFYIHIPTDKVGALVNNRGEVQTGDFPLIGRPQWVTVSGAGDDFSITDVQQTTGIFPKHVPFVPEELTGTIDMVAVYARVIDGWDAPTIWAWGARGDVFGDVGWPGGQMLADPNNEGWYYGFLPVDTNGWLVAGNEGTIQTADIHGFEGVPTWITIQEEYDVDGKHPVNVTTTQQTTGDIHTTAPLQLGPEPEPVETPDAPDITVRVFVPATWDNPHVWAWSAELGNLNVFAGWPGQPFSEKDGDWHVMQLPGWIDHIIINNGGAPQTDDIEISELGRDFWLVVQSSSDFEFSYTELVAEAAPRPAPVIITADPAAVTPTPAPTPAPADEGGLSVGAIVGIVAGVVVVLGLGAFLILKKKK